MKTQISYRLWLVSP